MYNFSLSLRNDCHLNMFTSGGRRAHSELASKSCDLSILYGKASSYGPKGHSSYMTNSSPKIAVIGAGCSGLTAIKECIAAGLKNVTCFEQNADIGGLWR